MNLFTRLLPYTGERISEPESLPLKSELFNADQMERHGERLASEFRLAVKGRGVTLLRRLRDNEDVLISVYDVLTDALRDDQHLTPSGEWLVDNFALIEEQIALAKRHLPKRYHEGLPVLASDPGRGLPRVYVLVSEIISHGDGQVAEPVLRRYISAHQHAGAVLKLAELWAIPIMLRLGLIENLRRVMTQTQAGRRDRNIAKSWAERLLDTAERQPKSLVSVVAELANSSVSVTGPFVSEFVRRLQGHGTALELPLSWLEQRLSAEGESIALRIASNIHEQTASQLSTSHTIDTLRTMDSWNWQQFVEALSPVEAELRRDPANVYSRMDFGSRDQYRHEVERASRACGCTETQVAEAANALARDKSEGSVERHVGFYLLDDGLPTLYATLGKQPPRDRRWWRSHSPLTQYLFLAGLLAGVIVYLSGSALAPLVLEHLPTLLLWAGISFVAFDVALWATNWLISLLIAPQRLPRMNFSQGIDPSVRVVVAIPTLLSSQNDVAKLLHELEVRFFANRDPAIRFVLLTDLPDASVREREGDTETLSLALAGIESLNRTHQSAGYAPFALLHRQRVWVEQQGVWMGHERKRGKLEALNRLITTGDESLFASVAGSVADIVGANYVITLDTDTNLGTGGARKLVATIRHPLNTPKVSEQGVVLRGHGILQPRVSPGLEGSNSSRYAELMGGEAGMDPYSGLVSSAYQDLFGEGSYVGKALYDVKSFVRTVHGRLPDDRILSHDLIEGGFMRAGLVSDVEMVEDYPANALDDQTRQQRWLRGDWQVLSWALPRIRGTSGAWQRNPLSSVTRWKLVDNVRRALVPPAQLLCLLLAWFSSNAPLAATSVVLAIMFLPVLIHALASAAAQPRLWRTHLTIFRKMSAAFFYELAVLPSAVAWRLSATVITHWRMWVTGKHLLEWRPSSFVGDFNSRRAFFTKMVAAPLLAITVGAALWAQGGGWVAAGLFLVAWMLAPEISRFLSLSVPGRTSALREDQISRFRQLSWSTWQYFESFMVAENHWLVPDNVQEVPHRIVAQRSSPTNIGLSMLVQVSAHDLGYIGSVSLIQRCTRILSTLRRLEKHEGHLLNWYGTLDLKPLYPRYVSSVDSGNFIGCLWVLKQALTELPDAALIPNRWASALNDVKERQEHSAEFARTLAQSDPQFHDRDGVSLGIFSQLLTELTDLAPNDSALATQINKWQDEVRLICSDGLQEIGESVRTSHSLRALSLSTDVVAARAKEILDDLAFCQSAIDELINVGWEFLYDRKRSVLSIGFNVENQRTDTYYYDLLASEARLATYVAIAAGAIPEKSWTALSRQLTAGVTPTSLVSWSGTMFEYLMPMLVMPSYRNSLLDHYNRAAVTQQISHGERLGLPWGISESGYNAVDASGNYQYQAFGVSSLGIKKGLDDDLVVAPYATILAAMLEPVRALENLDALDRFGMRTDMGYFEALDFTPCRAGRDGEPIAVRSYMAHHQAMSMLALASVVMDYPFAQRFMANPAIKSHERLLQERIPNIEAPKTVRKATRGTHHFEQVFGSTRRCSTPHTPLPEVQLLSNGRYHLMVTNAGGGNAHWNGLNLTRWREDTTRDSWGTFIYIRDAKSGSLWSACHQPSCAQPDFYEATFSDTAAEFRRKDQGIETATEIMVSPEDDVELRRVRLRNVSSEVRVIELTSYAEVVIATAAADAAHPAFSNLFVSTEIRPEFEAVLATRRARDAHETPPTIFQMFCVRAEAVGEATYETDRAKFVGRCRSTANPIAMRSSTPLSGTQGNVLDPILSIRQSVRIQPNKTVTIDLISGVAPTRHAALDLIAKYRDRRMADRIHDLSWTQNQVSLRQLAISEKDAHLFQQMASNILFINDRLRASARVIAANERGQSGLWAYSISGDLPLVLVKVRRLENLALVRELVKAHAYWKSRGMAVDLMIWNEDQAGYRQELTDAITGLISYPLDRQSQDTNGRIYCRNSVQMSLEDRQLQMAVARIVVCDDEGSLSEQVNRRRFEESAGAPLQPTRRPESGAYRGIDAKLSRPALLHNGRGGFSQDGREYVVLTDSQHRTPLPWSNVIANENFGTVVSESGGSYTWAENAHELRLTPWHNDPISDASGEAFYIRDEETGQYWSPTPLPCGGIMPYSTRHGFGYTAFEHLNRGIRSEMTVYVAPSDSVKIVVLKLANLSNRPRDISVTSFIQWVIGDHTEKCAPHVVTSLDPETGAIFARNSYVQELSGRVAFCQLGGSNRSSTADRSEFLGRNGALGRPAAMLAERLMGRTGAALDPCAAIRTSDSYEPGQTREIVFLIGLGGNAEHARQLVKRYAGSESARQTLADAKVRWSQLLGQIQVSSGDEAFDVLVNGWLLYQTTSCRLWARSGYYQSGGAFGFRDQIQDCLALVHTRPDLLRTQINLCASRQFLEGDVQHWWHPPTGRGVRTRCSDDFLWLPLAVCRYGATTNDWALLDESQPYLAARLLDHAQESIYDLPQLSGESGTIYDHCVRALRNVKLGIHGLPLMGAGDWNDGMNMVGIEGRGESVWLAFFYAKVLADFSLVAQRRGDAATHTWCLATESKLRLAVDEHAWDGEWYRRAYFDDGSPMGSAQNLECQIDSIAQSWSVLSTDDSNPRQAIALESLFDRLVKTEKELIQLLEPPFDRGGPDPGYIRGYPPGVRENGGQYTHAAIWAVMAFAKLGHAERAWKLAEMINPVHRNRTVALSDVYQGEPYVMAADIYGTEPHIGRSGWSWYTGSAGWMYRLLTESLLGLKREGDELIVSPVRREGEQPIKIVYRYGDDCSVELNIISDQGHGVRCTPQDGAQLGSPRIPLRGERLNNKFEVRVGCEP